MSERSYSMPWGFPYFGPPPFTYTGNRIASIMFETDAAVLRRLVPEPLAPNPEHIARFWVGKLTLDFGYSYMESGFLVPVRFGERLGTYVVCLYLDQTLPIVGGREIWGVPKVDAQLTLTEAPGHVTATVARSGTVLAEMDLSLKSKSDVPPEQPLVPWICMKLIPSVQENHLPDVMQLTSTAIPNKIQEYYTGDGKLSFRASSEDPLGTIPVLNTVQSSFEVSDWSLGYGEVLYDYLAEKEVVR